MPHLLIIVIHIFLEMLAACRDHIILLKYYSFRIFLIHQLFFNLYFIRLVVIFQIVRVDCIIIVVKFRHALRNRVSKGLYVCRAFQLSLRIISCCLHLRSLRERKSEHPPLCSNPGTKR